jgi:site-specific recombinase XerD
MLLSDAISLFLDHAEIGKNQSLKTVKNYRHYLLRFSVFAGDKDIVSIDLPSVQEMLGYTVFLQPRFIPISQTIN